jgi:hypothetical protein
LHFFKRISDVVDLSKIQKIVGWSIHDHHPYVSVNFGAKTFRHYVLLNFGSLQPSLDNRLVTLILQIVGACTDGTGTIYSDISKFQRGAVGWLQHVRGKHEHKRRTTGASAYRKD